jgi:hypothetical protein
VAPDGLFVLAARPANEQWGMNRIKSFTFPENQLLAPHYAGTAAARGRADNAKLVADRQRPSIKQGDRKRQVSLAELGAGLALLIAVLLGVGGQAAAASVAISSPANGATVGGVVGIATSNSTDVSMMSVFVDGTLVAWIWPATSPTHLNFWNSATVPNGPHTITAVGYIMAGIPGATAAVSIVVQNGPPPAPTPPPVTLPTPIAAPTPPPPPPTPSSYPLSDAAAASQVSMNPGFEPRPGNDTANHTVPTASQLAQVASLSFLDAHGNSLLAKVTGNFTGTTDEILQWASFKWGFDPDVTRANAVVESSWNQDNIGDIGNGVSLGILQIKSSDFTGTCDPVANNGGNISFVSDPLCLSHNSTAFAADYKLAYQRACMDGSITYLASQTPSSGYPSYTSATGADRLWGCIGDWFSGAWYDSSALPYIQSVQNNLANKVWLQPGF